MTDTSDEQRWPWDTSPDLSSASNDIASALLADIACQTPPSEIIRNRVESGLNTWNDFWPGIRFARAITAVNEAGGFPDLADFNDVYRATFDLIAKRWGWPEWEETIGSWLAKVHSIKSYRRSAGDAYRFRLVAEKYKRPGHFALGDPVLECFKQGIPVIYLTPNGLKVLIGVLEDPATTPAGAATTTSLVPIEIEDGVSAWSWLTAETSPWEDVVGRVNRIEALRLTTDRTPMLLQEIVSRTLSRAIHAAILDGAFFTCPFARAGCDVATTRCSTLRRTSETPMHGCALRTWLGRQGIDPNTLTWDEA